MSEGIRSDQPSSGSAADIQTRAADWVFDRYDSENWSAEDQAELDAWLNISLAHRVAYVRLETALDRSSRLAALRRARSASQERIEDTVKTRPFLVRTAVILAAIAIAVAGTAFVLLTPKTQVYATAVGGHETVTLADGSQVELNTDTVLRAKISTNERTIWLDKGEAYFRVKHEAASPFVVTAAGYRVRDLGTEFSIRNDPSHLEVTLIEGRARFESVGPHTQMRPSVLVPGDIVVATANKVSLAQKSGHELTDELAWRHGLLIFKYATLADVAAEFNRYNTKKLIIADSATARLTVMGKFPANNVEEFGQVAKTILGVRVDVRGDAVVISK